MAREGQSRALSEPEHQEFLVWLRSRRHAIRNTALIELGYRTGARIGSLAQLLLSDVLNADGSIKEVVILRSAIVKSGKTTRMFLVHERARSALTEWLAVRPSVEGLDNVFTTQRSTAFSPNSLSHTVLRLYEHAGFDGCSAHGLRRSFASNCLHSGADIVSLQTLLNHSNVNTTARYVQSDDATLTRIVSSAS